MVDGDAAAIGASGGPAKAGNLCIYGLGCGNSTRGPAGDYFKASEDWSTVTPGPMVELIEIFCR